MALRRYATLAEVLWNESGHEMGWVEALETPTLTALTEVYLLRAEAFLTNGAVPPRWRWCPECIGECRVCETTLGIIPRLRAAIAPPSPAYEPSEQEWTDDVAAAFYMTLFDSSNRWRDTPRWGREHAARLTAAGWLIEPPAALIASSDPVMEEPT